VLGIVPRGTGNLLAASFGIPQDIRGACEVLHNGHVHRLHLGRINQSYFTLAAGIGIDANIMRNTAPEQKRKIGLLAYFIEGFRQVFSARRMVMDIWVDGQRIRRKGKGMLVINNRNFLTAFNPFQSPTKDNLTDPKLDLCIFNLKNPMEALPALIQLFSQDYANPMLPIEHIRAEKIRLKTKPKVPIQADGDLIGKTPVTIEVLIEKLPVIIPEKLAQEGTGGSLIDTLSQNLEQVLANLLQIAPAQK
jgi:diacylglycerol kinase family enzyme